MKSVSEANADRPARSEFQKFESETIARALMKNAPYNPRKDMTPEQKEGSGSI